MKIFLSIILFLCLSSCEKIVPHEHTFYYWRTNLTLNKEEKIALEKSKVPFLYTRFFDIDKIDGKFQPVGVITKDKSFKTDKKIVPVVFIKNEILYGIKLDEISFLAESIRKLIASKGKELQLNMSDEIQIDCDWTAGTNKEYFQFLKILKNTSGKNITCTLRLHQAKDRSLSGIPPVEKVYLMCYATSSPLEDNNKNSILDVPTLKNYLNILDRYPLKVDIALPIYSWGIVTNHLGKHKLINALSIEELKKNSNFKVLLDDNFEVLNDGFYYGAYLSKGFKIKIEAVSQNDLDETLEFINDKLYFYNITYYHLDSRFIKNYKL